MKICFLLTHIPNPRMNRRIAVAKDCGEVSVICVRRASQDVYEPYYTDIPHLILNIDLPSSKKIVKRFFTSQKFQRKALELLELQKPDVLYTGGFDSLIIACRYLKKHNSTRLFYEVADLREIFIKKPRNVIEHIKRRLLQHTEKRCLPNIAGLIVTSKKFYDFYYSHYISKEKVIFIPNMPNLHVFESYVHKEAGPFTIGFIGAIRYLKQMKMLVDVAGKLNAQVLFSGAGGTTFDEKEIMLYCDGKDYVKFTGKYDYAKDIANLYGKVDCVFAVYDADNLNVRIALPNKLYEAIYCRLPIIVAKGTYLAEIVDETKVGIAVSHNNATELYNAIRTLSEDKAKYNEIVHNCEMNHSKINTNIYNKELLKHIKDENLTVNRIC